MQYKKIFKLKKFKIEFNYLTKKILEGIEFNEFYKNYEILNINFIANGEK